jgi:3-hydroxyisobutyrate dehydrogenase
VATNGRTDIGFIGLGSMGQPMVLNLARSGAAVTVWNRSGERCEPLRAAGAAVAATPSGVLDSARVVVLMVANGDAVDAVLGRGTRAFDANTAGRTIVQMGTTSPRYSRRLEADIRDCGGAYVEAPVSGSRTAAEAGQLVAMLAGEPARVEAVRPLLRPMCRETVVCGPVPTAMLMKLAVELFSITMVAGLVEAAHFAERHGVDLWRYQAIVDAGPMASGVSGMKIAKLLGQDFTADATCANVLGDSRLIAEAARESKVATPLLDVCGALLAEAVAVGEGESDMIAVLQAIEARSDNP